MIPVDPDTVIHGLLASEGAILAVDPNVRVVPLGNFVEFHDPLIVYARRGGDTNRTLGGDEALQNPSLQLDIYSADYAKAKALHDAVYDILTTVSQQTIGGHKVHSISVAQARDDDEPLLVGETIPPTVYTLDVTPWLERTA